MPNETEDSSNNRRQELRFRGHCQRVIMQKAECDPAPALLCDFSASGASLMITQRKNHPVELGEQIALRSESSHADDQIYQIRRVEPMGLGYVLAGCSRSAEAEMKTDAGHSPDLSTFANPPGRDRKRSTRRLNSDRPMISSRAHNAPHSPLAINPSFADGGCAA